MPLAARPIVLGMLVTGQGHETIIGCVGSRLERRQPVRIVRAWRLKIRLLRMVGHGIKIVAMRLGPREMLRRRPLQISSSRA